MTLEAGQRLGRYQIIARIGPGRSGEVWRARDTGHNRDVAIRFSQAQFSDTLQREANTIALLNHPNVCKLYDAGTNYVVMELVEGPTLADRISEGPIQLDEALAIAGQIADALDAAHEEGVVHRNLKPSNIRLTAQGVVKVLDFGLTPPENIQTQLTSDLSLPNGNGAPEAGTILGLVTYLAPEQARGKAADKRADIWAFGVVIWEMLTGRQMFEGETVSDMLVSVLRDEPDLGAVPAKARRLLAKCLEKDPKKRLRDIGDYGLLLEDAAVASGPAPGGKAARSHRSGAIAAKAAMTFALGLFLFREKAPLAELARFVSGVPSPTTISIDFVGGSTRMASSEVSGVVPSANWNNAPGASSSTPLKLVDQNGKATGTTVRWVSDNVWFMPFAASSPDYHMMQGYLDNGRGEATSVVVSALAAGTYNIYVYCDGDNNTGKRAGIYQIGGPGIKTTSVAAIDAPNSNFGGIFTEAESSAGNYVLFSNVKVTSGFTLKATPDAGTKSPRAPINGIQIVPAADE